MKSLHDISAERVATDDFQTVNHDESLSQIKARMEQSNLREIPVVEDGDLKGMVSYKSLIDHINVDPSNTKVGNVMHQPPKATADMSLVDLAVLRRDSGQKRFIMQEGERLSAVIGEEEIVYALTKSVSELHNFTVKDLMNTELVTLAEDDKHDKAISLMREHDISRIPITNNRGGLEGVVTSQGILRTMVPQEQMQQGDYKGHKESTSNIPCSGLMTDNVPTVSDTDLSLSKAIRKMEKAKARELIVVNKKEEPTGIITLRDIIDFISTFENTEQVLVNLIGVEDKGKKDRLHSKIEQAVRGRLSRIVNNLRELNVHVKTYETEGGRQKYSLHSRMFSELGITIVEKADWKLLQTMDRVIDSLAEQARKEKEKRRDRIREQWREGKYNH